MQKLNTTATLFYSIVVICSLMALYLLISVLDWPVMAEVPLAASIFIQILAISRRIFKSWNAKNSYDASTLLFKVKTILFENHGQPTDK